MCGDCGLPNMSRDAMEPKSATDGRTQWEYRGKKAPPIPSTPPLNSQSKARLHKSRPPRGGRKEGTIRLRPASFRRAYSKLMVLVAVLGAIRHGEGWEIGPLEAFLE